MAPILCFHKDRKDILNTQLSNLTNKKNQWAKSREDIISTIAKFKMKSNIFV